MTIDDLMKAFDLAHKAHSRRAGIEAVVRALRDEMASGTAWHAINEILGDAGEKVGTHGSPELDEDAFKLQAMGKDPGMTIEEFLDEHFKPPATDPAPVCKWTLNTLPEPDGGSHYETSCGDAWCRWYNTPKEDNYSYCPSCGKPIKFTEAKD